MSPLTRIRSERVAGGQWALLAASHVAAVVIGGSVMFVRCWRRCDRRHHIEDPKPPDWLCGRSGETD